MKSIFLTTSTIVAYCIVGCAMTIVNKLVMQKFPYPNFILVLQCIATIFLVCVAEYFVPSFTGKVQKLEHKIVKKWLGLTILFVCMLLSSMSALETVSIPTVIVMRNLATIVTAILDVMFLKTNLSWGEGTSILVMLMGAYWYGRKDMNFSPTGYVWLGINVMSTSLYQVYVKYLVKVTQLNSSSMTYYNNMLCLPFLVFGCQIGDELNGVNVLIEKSLIVKVYVFISTLLGFGMSITGFILNHMISATSIMVVNNVNKFVLIFISEAFIEQTQTWSSGAACVLVMLSSATYSYCRLLSPSTTNLKSFEYSKTLRRKVRYSRAGCLITFGVIFVTISSHFYKLNSPALQVSSFRSGLDSGDSVSTVENKKGRGNLHKENFIPKIYGLLEMKDDGNITREWFDKHYDMFDGILVFDGSSSNEYREFVEGFPNVIYTHETDHQRKYFTDSEHRGIALKLIQKHWGYDNWIMVCHTDSFYYHIPRLVARAAQADGADHIVWYALHILPHPKEFELHTMHPSLPVTKKFRHFHWYGYPKGGFGEHRMFKNRVDLDFGVEWCSGPPHGVNFLWDKHPAYLHYKIPYPDISLYDEDGHHKVHFSNMKLHPKDPFFRAQNGKMDGKVPRVGLSWKIHKTRDFFVENYKGKPKYRECTYFDGKLPDTLDSLGPMFRAPSW